MIWVVECMLRIRQTVYPACGIYRFTPRKLEYDRRRASIITRALPSLDQMDRIIWPILTSQLSCVKEFTLCPNILVICSLWDSKSEEYWWSELQLVRTWNLHLWRVAGPISHSSIIQLLIPSGTSLFTDSNLIFFERHGIRRIRKKEYLAYRVSGIFDRHHVRTRFHYLHN